jgi:hypothetical protein
MTHLPLTPDQRGAAPPLAPAGPSSRAHTYLARSILAYARNFNSNEQDVVGVVRRLWPTDKVTPLVCRAFPSPGGSCPTGWTYSPTSRMCVEVGAKIAQLGRDS